MQIETKVIHSQTKPAWNVVCMSPGEKYKIARVPYTVSAYEVGDTINRSEALAHALFISRCFNQSEKIMAFLGDAF